MTKKTLEQTMGSPENHLDKSFFARDPEIVAKELLGTYIIRVVRADRILRGRICEVAAYEGRAKKTHDVVDYPAGTLGVSTKYGKHLIDIATGKRDDSSCVTLIGALFECDSELIQGPGNLSKVLEVDRQYDGSPINGQDLWIEKDPHYKPTEVEVKKRDKSGLPENCRGYFYINF